MYNNAWEGGSLLQVSFETFGSAEVKNQEDMLTGGSVRNWKHEFVKTDRIERSRLRKRRRSGTRQMMDE